MRGRLIGETNNEYIDRLHLYQGYVGSVPSYQNANLRLADQIEIILQIADKLGLKDAAELIREEF